jgi:aminomethyltransferase
MGADFMEWGGWYWTLSFGDPVGEYLAVRTQVGLVDGSPLRKWDVRGSDAGRALDRLVTQDCAGMRDGQIHYTPLCAEDGTMLDDVTVFRFAEDHYQLMAMMDSDEDHCRSYVTDLDVEFVPATHANASMQLQGPASREVITAAAGDVTDLPYFHFRTAEIAGVACVLSRTGYSGELGYEVFCDPEYAPKIWNALMDAGAPHQIRPYGMAAVDLLRTESALVIVESEYEPGRHTPYDVNLGWAVKLKKEEFVGRSALLDTSRRSCGERLVGLVFPGEEPPEDGSPLMSGGDVVGRVTIARRSPVLERTIGLGLLANDAETAGDLRAGEAQVEIAPQLPFYDPDKTRPRSAS